VVNFSICPGHKCPGYVHPPLRGEGKTFTTIYLDNSNYICILSVSAKKSVDGAPQQKLKKSLTRKTGYVIKDHNKEIIMSGRPESQVVVLSQIILLGIIEGIIILPSPPDA